FSNVIQGFWRAKDWNWTPQQLNRYINELVERGITTMDHADIYGDYSCEGIFGEALKLSPNLREHLEIVSKCGIVLPSDNLAVADGHRYDHSKKHITETVERSLKQLQVEQLDSLLINSTSSLIDQNVITEAVKSLIEDGTINYMYKDDVKIMSWSTLAGGKLFDLEDEKTARITAIISPLAQKYNVTTTAIIMSWLKKHPASIMPVLGTQKINRIDEA